MIYDWIGLSLQFQSASGQRLNVLGGPGRIHRLTLHNANDILMAAAMDF